MDSRSSLRERKRIPHLPDFRGRSEAARALTWMGWAIVAFLGLVIVVRFIAWDKVPVFAELDAAIEVLFLPAWLVLLAGLLGRRWWLAGAALCICAVQIIYVAPEVLASSPVPAAALSEPSFRLFDANVAQFNYSMEGYVAELKSYHPDVLAMEETIPSDYTQLKSAGVLATLPYQYQIECCGSRGFILASRYPLRHVKVYSVEGLAYLISSSLVLPNGTINFWVVHTTAPTNPSVHAWNMQLDGIYQQLEKAHPRPLLMVGDFNATWGNRGFRAILSTGLIDAAAARGHPFAFTWSQTLPILPPILRIDHVLTAGDVTVTTIQTHLGPGSDHRDLTATVATGRA
jgi:endonuclease/exonuclease/phosphatase (EEP) superfamily protein YafD